MNSGPVAQLMPTESSGACMTEAYSASTSWPASIVPIGSIVTETMTGVRQPTSANACSMPMSPALRFRVSCVVSTQQHVRAARHEADCLRAVVPDHLVEGHAAGDGHGLRRRAHRPRDEAQAAGGRGLGRRLARDLGGAAVDLDGLVRQAVLGEHERRAPEGVRLDHVGAGREVVRVHFSDEIGPRQDQVLVAALEVRTSEILRRQVLALHPRPRRPVEHEDALGEKLLERLRPLALRRAAGNRDFGHGNAHYAGIRGCAKPIRPRDPLISFPLA